MIPSKIRRDGVKGRFDPSEPLHMTTRHAARSVRVNSDPSINGSYEGDDNRRASFDEVRSTTSRGFGSPTSIKGRRISGTSTESAPAMETRSSERKRRRSSEKVSSSDMLQQSPARKRKRSSPTPQPDTPHGSKTISTPPANQLGYPFNSQFIEVVPREDLSDRDMGGSSPSGSDEQLPGDYLGITESTEFTPAVSEAVSPASEDSDTEIGYPAKDIIKAAFPQVVINGTEDADDVDDLGDPDDGDDIDDADDVDEGDEQARLYGDGFPRRRWTGRRRADHPVPEIEATMRRQLALKSTYRAICRSLKPVLAEIAMKTVEELQANPTKHEEVIEYQGTEDEPGIQQQLDKALERREQQIHAQLKWNRQLLTEAHVAEAKVRRAKCQLQIEQMRDQHFDRLEHEMLVIARKAQLSEGNAAYETEDEGDDIAPRPKATDRRFVRKAALDPKYDSRSREALEIENATKDLHARYEMTKMLRDFEEVDQSRKFTVMDPRPRNAAIARSMGIRNTNTLASAAAEVEVIAKKPVIPVAIIPNREAHNLQVLSDLASQSAPIRPLEPKPEHELKPVVVDSSIQAQPTIQMPPPLPPPPPPPATVRRNVALDVINLLNEWQPNVHRQPSNLPGLSFSSPRRSSVPDPISRETGLISPNSHQGHISAFQSPSVTRQPPQPRESAPSLHHNRTVSLGTPPRSDPPQFLPVSAGRYAWNQAQPSLGRSADTRNARTSQPTSHLFSQDGPLRIERVSSDAQESRQAPPRPEDRFNDNSPSNHLLARPLAQSQPQSQRDVPGNTEPGATDSRKQLLASPHRHSRDASASTPAQHQRSRASSIKSQSTNRDFTPDSSSVGESGQQQNRRDSQVKHPGKRSKAERNGSSRRQYKKNPPSQGSPAGDSNKPQIQKFGSSQNTPVSETKGTMGRFRLNKAVTADTTSQHGGAWGKSPAPGTSQSGQPATFYQPHDMYGQQPGGRFPGQPVPPPLPGFPHQYYTDPHHAQRSSLPGPGQQPWQPASSSPPVFGMPQGTHPPGFQQHEHWQRQQQQQQQQYVPLNPARGPQGTMQPVAAPVAQQYGGPMIAPATGPQDPRSIYGNAGSVQHLPVFAQQRENSRKRAQSEVQTTKFLPYTPKEKPSR